MATRKKMLAAVERGESVVSVARRFQVTQQGLHKLIKRCHERGTHKAAGAAFGAVGPDECANYFRAREYET